jgi:hypothetical protein
MGITTTAHMLPETEKFLPEVEDAGHTGQKELLFVADRVRRLVLHDQPSW